MIKNLPKYFSDRAIFTFFIILIVLSSLNFNTTMPFLWVIASSFTVMTFFYFLNILPKLWGNFSDTYFRKKLFITALIIRVVVVCIIYFLFELLYNEPFEFGAADSRFYTSMASVIADKLVNGDLSFYEQNLVPYTDFSDRGYPIVLGIIYSFAFKSILLSRFVHALLGAWSCVLIYDFSKRNFNETTARLAGIIMMLLPNLIYYTCINLKETAMIFLLIVAINYADKLQKEHKNDRNLIILLVISMFSLFLFRTVLAVSALFSFFFSSLVMSSRITGYYKKSLIIFLLVIMSGFIFNSFLIADISQYLDKMGANQEKQLAHFANRENGNKFAKYGSKAIFAPLILSAPFATLVDTGQENQMLIAGAVFTRSIYSFFIFVALYLIYKQGSWRRFSLILALIGSYLTVLLFSGFVISERFHLPLLPFLAVLSAHGIYCVSNTDQKYRNYYVPFLIFISLVIVGWNLFKLAGRDLI